MVGKAVYGLLIPGEMSEVDPEKGSGSEFHPNGSEVNSSMFPLLSHLIPGIAVTLLLSFTNHINSLYFLHANIIIWECFLRDGNHSHKINTSIDWPDEYSLNLVTYRSIN